MKKLHKLWIVLAAAMAVMLGGCGEAEVTMKEFTSADGAVSVSMNDKWALEDMGVDSWIAAFTEDGSEGIVVMQMPKHLYNIDGIAGLKGMVEESFTASEATQTDAPAVPGVNNVEAYRCVVTASGVKGQGIAVYGETDYAYYGIVYAAKKINDSKTEYFNRVCGTLKETVPEIENASTVASTDTILWFNATCAVLTDANGWDYTMFGGLPANEDSAAIVQSLLDEWWGVTDQATAKENMDWLTTQGHRTEFADSMAYLEESGIEEIPAEERADFMLENFDVDEQEAQNYADWYAVYEEKGEDAIAGWDYSRAMSLLGYYYLAGYYTEEEALNVSFELAQTIQGAFDSWDSFMESYFAGYEYWAEESSEERRGIYADLKAASDSPYSVDFNLTLEKTW